MGIHFFSPVDRMAFVELIPHAGTSMHTIKRAQEFAHRMGKTSIVVADKPGFFTSRIYARWLIEGIRLLLEGYPIDVIDAAAVALGFPIGPMQAHDEAGLDLVVKASILQVAQPVMSNRLDVDAVRASLERLTNSGVLGRQKGRGFYEYEKGRRMRPNPDIDAIMNLRASSFDGSQIGERLLLAFATESFLCWDDGTLSHPDDGDVASVVAIGFPRRLGGPFHWADSLGAEVILAMSVSDRTGALMKSAEMSQFVQSKEAFGDAPRRELPAKPEVVGARQ
jgi:3-hydroxyacyl-CoA dehydrogenase/enoyl-CoA hydratase/3-hydroxybutyryl-CoA epimerase